MSESVGAPPLSGLRVLDCTTGTAGTRATGILADYGADVIWIEPPGGDRHRQRCATEYSAFLRNKRSRVLDLHTESGRAALRDLLAHADVFVQSWRPGVAESLGLSFPELHREFPGLVCCSISGFGPGDEHPPGIESLVRARVGTMADQVGHRDGPIYEAFPFASTGAAYLASIGILAALYRRLSDGWGRHVETSLLDGAVAYMMHWGTRDGSPEAPVQRTVGQRQVVVRTYLCSDDKYISVHTGAKGAFVRLMRLLGLAEQVGVGMDESHAPMAFASPEVQQILAEELPEIFAARSSDEWIGCLLANDIAVVPCLAPGEVFDTPQVRHNGMVLELVDPVLGPVQQVAPAIRFGGCVEVDRRPAPRVGEHGDAVFSPPDGLVSAWAPPSMRGVPDERPLLADVRVLDLGAWYAGPFASRLLGDLGADVVKVEPPVGDPMRGRGPHYFSAQANKRAVAIDLKAQEGQGVGQRLVAWADVVHHNMRPGAAERLGLGYGQIQPLNPTAIYVHSPGWGSTGPYSARQSFAPLLSSYVGLGAELAGRYNPPLFPAANEDSGNGLLGAVGTLMSLVRRTRCGGGQFVENPQVNAALSHMAHIVRTADGRVLGAGRLDPLQFGFGALDRLYQTKDGWICLAVCTPAHLKALDCLLAGRLCGDSRFTTLERCAENDNALDQLLCDVFASRATADVLADCAAFAVPAVEVIGPNNHDFFYDPEQIRAGRVAACALDDGGTYREVAQLIRFTDAAIAPHRHAPVLGADTDEVLGAIGIEENVIRHLRETGVLR